MPGSKVVLVTGASSGIGRATADLLQARGHHVIGTSRRENPGEAPWTWARLDVTEDASVMACVAGVLASHGRIDAVVNNAGLVMAGAVEDTSIEEARRSLETNVLGAMRVARAALPAMRERGSGTIVNMGSLAGRVGMPFQGIYSASKFALEGLTEALAQEVVAFGIDVALVAPGDTATPVVDNRVRTVASKDPASPYAAAFVRVVAMYEKDERAGAPPAGVAALVADLVEGRRHGPRYAVGPFGQRVMVAARGIVPGGVFRWGMSRYFGLQR
ncbi:MAG: SDR family oxidoreductase [Phreatobacter sp.]|uniref:SDR family oxidoreductase n=1 Tax=Phreatobacter sp. TaxID=1966341 RepID=UPI002735874F|nr:SDR family oxidoreductase [Phreatobacter sp.]MDP2801974.1 SDR family oxidoreductase [Phreatobacter sp.]